MEVLVGMSVEVEGRMVIEFRRRRRRKSRKWRGRIKIELRRWRGRLGGDGDEKK